MCMFDKVNSAILFAFLAIALWAVVQYIGASERVDYCYIHAYDSNHCGLFGHINWRYDQRLGVFESLDEALTAAEKLHCRTNTPE